MFTKSSLTFIFSQFHFSKAWESVTHAVFACTSVMSERWMWSLPWSGCFFTDANVPWERVLWLDYDAQPARPQTRSEDQRWASETGHRLHRPVLHLHQKVNPVCSNVVRKFESSKVRNCIFLITRWEIRSSPVSHFWKIKRLTCKPFHITVKAMPRNWKMGKILSRWRFEFHWARC